MGLQQYQNSNKSNYLRYAFGCLLFLGSCANLPNTSVNKSQIVDDLSEITKNHSEIFQLSDNDRPGSWCWFQDQRVIMDTNNPDKPILITGAVTYGDISSDKRGDVDLYWAEISKDLKNPISKKARITLDDQLQMDDHASPSFLIRPDGRYLVNWSKHGNDKFIRTKISTNPNDPTVWNETILSDAPQGGITYTNPIYLSEGNNGNGQIFNGIRSRGFDSNFIYSNDLGENWVYGGQTLNAKDAWPDHADGGRAYVKYAGDGKSKVHLFATDDHPRVNFNADRSAPGPYLNSIYHAYIENGKLHKTDGTVIDENLYDENASPPTAMTLLLKDSTLINAMAMRRGWITDIKITPDNHPFGVIQFRANDNQKDHRYFYVRHDGKQWHVNFMAYAGDNFGFDREGDYTGLASVGASNPDIVFISTSANPITGKPLISSVSSKQQNEIYMGKTKNYGKTWTWVALTKNSEKDNLRPIVPKWTKDKSAVLWMQGNYPKFYEYDTKIVGQIIHHK
ncbi:BNR-4 repeat-containing protein [uncultured Polaribacter sp.]|uniref:BNR-4 repeat-containing protein n=1 Tax=uncultured Polaribacter sp. TaxID=174711 RepID=UPI002618F98A|nr:BNR-4 repeat-containing protein [uncultured Polaribacter sp.]